MLKRPAIYLKKNIIYNIYNVYIYNVYKKDIFIYITWHNNLIEDFSWRFRHHYIFSIIILQSKLIIIYCIKFEESVFNIFRKVSSIKFEKSILESGEFAQNFTLFWSKEDEPGSLTIEESRWMSLLRFILIRPRESRSDRKKNIVHSRTAIFNTGIVCRASFKLSSFRSKTLLIELLITRTAYVKPLCEECAHARAHMYCVILYQ